MEKSELRCSVELGFGFFLISCFIVIYLFIFTTGMSSLIIFTCSLLIFCDCVPLCLCFFFVFFSVFPLGFLVLIYVDILVFWYSFVICDFVPLTCGPL